MSEKFRRHPALLTAVETAKNGRRQITMSTWDGGPPLIVDDPRLLAAMSRLPTGDFSRAQALEAWTEGGLKDVVEPLWSFCTGDRELIVAGGDGDLPRHGGYQGATRSYPFLDMSQQSAFVEDNQLMRDYMTATPYPPVYTELPHDSRRPLPDAQEILGRAGGYALHEQLALLIDGTVGERDRLDYADDGQYMQVELIRKAVPSGGSRHPTEALLYLRVEGFPEGLYHFNVSARSLDLLSCQPPLACLAAVCPALAELLAEPSGAAAVVMLASQVERAMWRYRDPRSFRAVAIDVGHVVQHLAEVGAWLGWTWTDVPGADLDALANRMGLDAVSMPVFTVGVLRK